MGVCRKQSNVVMSKKKTITQKKECKMIGTEKQKIWAEDLKRKFDEKASQEIAYALDRSQRGNMPKEFHEVVLGLYKKMLAKMETWTAKQFIENRQFLFLGARIPAEWKKFLKENNLKTHVSETGICTLIKSDK